MRVGVVDIGSNSTRLLVADVAEGRVERLARRTEVTRLGQGVDESGRLGEEAKDRVRRVLARYREELDAHSIGRAAAVLTSAVRDAANGPEFVAELGDAYGLDARTLPGEEEARLTFLGATAERDRADETPLLVIDVGGGSTELVLGTPRAPGAAVSTNVGVVRQTERHLRADPPDPGELAALRAEAREIFARERPPGAAAAAIAVAGTATSLAAIDLALDPYDPERVHGHRISCARAEEILTGLAAQTEAERREVPGLHPDRAPTIVAGAAILLAALETFGLDGFEASEHGILTGAALDLAAGDRTG